MSDADSTDEFVKCEIPYIQSTQSLNTFHIDKPGVILGDRPIFSDVSLRDAAYDGQNFPIAENTGTDCYIGTRFPGDSSGFMVGILEEVKFFIDWFPNKATYESNLKI
jgi:hypothetical protein